MVKRTPKTHKNRFIDREYLNHSNERSKKHSTERLSTNKRVQANTNRRKSFEQHNQQNTKKHGTNASEERTNSHSSSDSEEHPRKTIKNASTRSNRKKKIPNSGGFQEKNSKTEKETKSKKDVFFRNVKHAEKSKDEIEEVFEEEQSSSSDEKVAQTSFNAGKKAIAKGFKKVKAHDKSIGSNTSASSDGKKRQNTVYDQSKTRRLNKNSNFSLQRKNKSANSSISKKAQQKKSYQKAYHYKKGNRAASAINNTAKNGKAAQALATAIQKIGASVTSAISAKAVIIGGAIILLIVALYLLIVMLFGVFGSSLDSIYLFTPAQATVIEQRYTEKELDYLDKIINEADNYRGDFNTTINYDPVGHDPHEILSLFNILFIYDMSTNEEEEYSFDLDKVDTIIEDLIEARYTFKKDVEEVVRTVTVENEDGTTSQQSITTTLTYLTSTTQSISNIIGGASYSTPANTAEFIRSIGEEAREIAGENDIYASVMIAQAILETGSGGSDLGKPPHFNLFGIKGSYNGDSVTMYTKEDDGTGNQYTISGRFRDYPSYKESLLDYAIVMREQPSPGFYAPTYKSNTNSYRDATNYLTGTYATDTQYASKLNQIIQQNNLTEYDTQGTTSSTETNKNSEKSEEVEKTISGNIFSLTEYEQELYDRTLEQRGLMGGYPSPVEGLDWGAKIKEPYGLSWNEEKGERYKTDGLLLNVGSGKNVQSQVTGKVTKVTEKNGLATVTITSADTITFEYSNLKNINISKGNQVKKGQVIGKTTSDGLLLNAFDSRGNEVNPQIIMYTETLKPTMYNAGITSINSGFTPSGNNQLNQNMAGQSYDDIDVQHLFDVAKQYIGYPYVFGGASPSTSFDCSGFIYWVYKEAGLKNWGRTTANGLYYTHSAPITEEEARPGDLVFFENTYNAGERFTHVGIYAGDGIMLHAGNPIGFTSFKTSYWQSHQPTFGRLTQD